MTSQGGPQLGKSGGPELGNRANAIRPFARGRRAWLFADSVKGAKASAAFFSLVETAKANGLEPYAYLCRLFERLPHAKTVEDFEALLPFSTFDLSPQ